MKYDCLTPVRHQHAIDHLQKGRLSRTVRPGNRNKLAWLRLDRDAHENRRTFDGDMDIEELNRMVHQPFLPCARNHPGSFSILTPHKPASFMSLAIILLSGNWS